MAIDGTTSITNHVPGQTPAADARPDAAAFGALYDAHLPGIYAFIARRVEDRANAEELTAATFERAVGASRSGFGSASFASFLYRVAASAVIDHARRQRRTIPLGMRARDFDQAGDPEAAEELSDQKAVRSFAAAIDRVSMRRAIVNLGTAHRHVLLLRYFDGLVGEELAAALGSSEQSAALAVHRALRGLRGAIEGQATDAA